MVDLSVLTYKEGTTTTIQLSIAGVTADWHARRGRSGRGLSSGNAYTAICSGRAQTCRGTVTINASASATGSAGNIADSSTIRISLTRKSDA